MQKYYQLINSGKSADLYIYGDITSYPWAESDVDAYSLVNELTSIDGVENINVYINSYGGEVAEGLAIYNALVRHPAKVTTICDGFACSIASVIFMAGDNRVMGNASLLMIHNPWTYTAGNANELRKEAEDLDKIAEASYAAYLDKINIDRDKLKELLDAETWLTPLEAVDMGFATVIKADANNGRASQSIKKMMMQKLSQKAAEPPKEKEEEQAIGYMELIANFLQKKER